MTKSPLIFALVALSSLACATASAKKIASPLLVAEKTPYTIDLVNESGERLETHQHRGRFYVHGQAGERYSIRVNNPTDRRVEAVISVDGLDVVDGETADFKSKRGYVVPARGNLVIDGFRVSTQAVAAFRFSSVAASYAGRKGKARNVGVVGVALFAEKARPQLVLPVQPTIRPRPRPHHHHGRKTNPAPNPDNFDMEESKASTDDRLSEAPRSRPAPSGTGGAVSRHSRRIRPDFQKKKERSGLGTRFGERRSSGVSFTQFVRAHQTRPTSFAELRYNDARGLLALGIRLQVEAAVSQEELATRETASPFPGTRFAQPPR
jgi:hypothetical protein